MPPALQGVVALSNRCKLEFGVVKGLAETMRLRLKSVMNEVGLETLLLFRWC